MLERLLDSLRAIIRSEFPDATFAGTWEYVIQSVDGQKVDADPTDTTIPLPSIRGIVVRSSTLGDVVVPTVGSLILVQFVNRNPSRPVAISVSPTNKTVGFDATSSIAIGGTGLPSARQTDTILAAGMFAGTITSGSAKVTVG